MIIIHEGVPGSGKSYDAVRKIIDALAAGRVVYTNIRGLDLRECREAIGAKIGKTADWLSTKLFFVEDEKVPIFWELVPDGAFIVIDEAQLFFNSRDFSKKENRQFGDWASTHRHRGFDLLLITQRAERIDTSVRSLAEFRYRYRKLNVFGRMFKNGYLVYSFAGEDRQHMALRKMSYDVSIFPCYQSYIGDNTEKKVFKAPNLLNHPIFYAMGLCLVALIYFGGKSNIAKGRFLDVTGGQSGSSEEVANPQLQELRQKHSDKTLFKDVPKIQDTEEMEVVEVPQFHSGPGRDLSRALRAGHIAAQADDVIIVDLDGYIENGKIQIVTSRGLRLSRWLRLDIPNMTAAVRRIDLPAGLLRYVEGDTVRRPERLENGTTVATPGDAVAVASIEPKQGEVSIVERPTFRQSGMKH